MTHENAGTLLAHGRKKSDIFRLKQPSSGSLKNMVPAQNSIACHLIRHMRHHQFPLGRVNSLLYLADDGKCWQTAYILSKKRFRGRIISFSRFLSLSDISEKKVAGIVLNQVFSQQMAYSLTPSFITLQNDVL